MCADFDPRRENAGVARLTQGVEFSLMFRSCQQYDHSYEVPLDVIAQGEQAVKEYIVQEALDDILYVQLDMQL